MQFTLNEVVCQLVNRRSNSENKAQTLAL